MTDLLRLEVSGIDGVLDTLKSLPANVVSKNGGPVKLALAKGARLLRDAARAAAPVKTGLLRENIIVRRGKYEGKGELYVVKVKTIAKRYVNNSRNRRQDRVGKRYEIDGPAFYGRFLEYGTKKMPAKAWLRPAAQANAQKIIDTVSADLVRRVNLIVKKQGAK